MERFRRENREQIQKIFEEKTGVRLNVRPQRPRWVRMALTVACVCAVLLGAVYAVELASGIRISFFTEESILDEDKMVSGPQVEMEVEYIPLERFSKEAKRYFASYQNKYIPNKYFSSWSDAEEFLGIELQDNPVLDQIYAIDAQHTTVDGQDIKAHCKASFSSISGEGLIGIRLFATYLWSGPDASGIIRGIDITLDSRIHIKEAPWDEEPEFEVGYYNLVDMEIEEEYTTPSGLEAAIVRTLQVDEFRERQRDYVRSDCTYTAYFTLHGVSFSLSATSHGIEQYKDSIPLEPELALTALKEVLDGFS